MTAIAKDWTTLRHGTPGRRFYDVHRARSKRRGEGWPLERIVTLAVGAILLLGGLAIGWLPGPGGFIGIFGAALVGAESLRIAKLMDRMELRLRGAWRFVRHRLLGRPSRESERSSDRGC
jgi:hypothetical protein